MANYHTDIPLDSPDDDLFGRNKFAENIAEVIASQPMDEKYVIGLYSPWGYGKTSVLNMMEDALKDKEAITVRYNPWIYSDIKSMTIGLLSTIGGEIIEATQGDSNKFQKRLQRSKLAGLRGVANELASSLGAVAESISIDPTGGVVKMGGKGVSGLLQTFGQKSLSVFRKNVEKKIKELNKRIVVVIDDVDRLDKDEIFQLFKLVKAVADFSGITYVIALDNIAVAKALNGRFSSDTESQDGKDFLEKIIQIPLDLPVITTEELQDMFVGGLNSLIKEYDLDMSDDDQRRFWDSFSDHMLPRLNTPRAVKRYLNLLTFTLPSSRNELNATDIVVLTGLRLLYPNTYKNIQSQKKFLTGTNYEFEFGSDDDKRKKKKQEYFEKLIAPNETSAGRILVGLFPVVQNAYGSSSMYNDSDDIKRDKRVASVDYFDRYFIFGVGKSDVADSEIISILQSDDTKKITQDLKKIATSPAKQKLIIHKIQQYKDIIPDIKIFLSGLIGATDSLSTSPRGGFLSIDGGMNAFSRLVFDLIKSAANKIDVIKSVLDYCNDNELLAYVIRDVNLTNQKDASNPDNQPLLTDEEFSEFKSEAVKKIAKMAKTNKFYETSNGLAYYLYNFWAEFSDSNDEVESNLKSKIKTSDDALGFLTGYLQRWTNGGGGEFRGNFDNPTYSATKQVLDPQYLYDILIKEDDSLKDIDKFVQLEDRFTKNPVNKAGNEKSKEFKTILAQEFAFIHKQAQKKEDSEEKA